jgi:hypothetical protein
MTNIQSLAAKLLSTEKLVLGKPEYQRITLEQMRENVLTRAKETLEALNAYEGGVLDAPMARTGLNAIVIKIGYGDKNEALVSFLDEINEEKAEFRANGVTREEQKERAVEFFEAIIPAIEAGGLDEKIKEKLKSYQERGEKGKEARKKKAQLRAEAKRNSLAIAAE